jgi:15-cis-phytoene synthase
MSIQTSSWEPLLIARAREAFENRQAGEPPTPGIGNWIEPALLEKAYSQCVEITRQHSRTFFLASGLLPPEKRRAARALYAFCRISDDLVDCSFGEAVEELKSWQKTSLGDQKMQNNLVVMAWIDTRQRYHIPLRYAEQLLEGVAHDLKKRRYESFTELAAYSYGVASTVGLMSMHIIGFTGPEAIPYAVKLGVALQLTNILRDVGEDWRAGRLYLPREELFAFGLDEEEISKGVVTEAWRDFMRFQIERTRELYAVSLPGIKYLQPDGRFAIAAAAILYEDILKDIEEHDYDVFNRRAHVPTWEKLLRLPGIWREVRKR